MEGAGTDHSLFQPRILGLLCHWCSYSGADTAGRAKKSYAPNVHVVRVMCSCRIAPTHILNAFLQGYDGVLVCGCHPGGCHYGNGNLRTLGRVTLLRKMLVDMGVEDERLRLEWVSATEGEKYARIVNEMTETVRGLGPRRSPDG